MGATALHTTRWGTAGGGMVGVVRGKVGVEGVWWRNGGCGAGMVGLVEEWCMWWCGG